MFAVIISRIINRIKVPVDLEVKTKNPVVKVTAFNQLWETGPFLILTSLGTAS